MPLSETIPDPDLLSCLRCYNKVNLMKSYLSGRAGCLYRQAAGS
jgi:hypothetical protein